jgi:hypothetical protein
MSYFLDPAVPPVAVKPAPADWKALREAGELSQAALAALHPPPSGMRTARHLARSADGTLIELRWYTRTDTDAAATAAVVYAHGGAMVMGTLDAYDGVIGDYVASTGVPFLSVGYRRAPDEGSGTTLAEDVYAGITWLIEHAAQLTRWPSYAVRRRCSSMSALAPNASIRGLQEAAFGVMTVSPASQPYENLSDRRLLPAAVLAYLGRYLRHRADPALLAPAECVRRPLVPPESPTLGLGHPAARGADHHRSPVERDASS